MGAHNSRRDKVALLAWLMPFSPASWKQLKESSEWQHCNLKKYLITNKDIWNANTSHAVCILFATSIFPPLCFWGSKLALLQNCKEEAFRLPRLNRSERGGITLLLFSDKSSHTSRLLSAFLVAQSPKIQQKAVSPPPTPPPLPTSTTTTFTFWSCMITASTLSEVSRL